MTLMMTMPMVLLCSATNGGHSPWGGLGQVELPSQGWRRRRCGELQKVSATVANSSSNNIFSAITNRSAEFL